MCLPGLIDFLDIPIDIACKGSVEMMRSLTADAADLDSDGSSDSGASAYSSDSLGDALADLQTDTTCLLDLAPLLSTSNTLVDVEPIRPDSWEVWKPSQAYSDKISTRFPQAANFVIQRLGQANYDRYIRCQEERSRNQSVPHSSGASAGNNADAASSKFHDSGIGSSIPTTYAETVMSYGADEGRRVCIPPLSAQAKDGTPFECMCCGNLVMFRTDSDWKQHIYADLQPWICLEAKCPTGGKTFPTRKDWIAHLSLDHGLAPDWAAIICPLCQCDTGPGKVAVTKHLSTHLEEVSLAALPADCDFDEGSAASELEGDLYGELPLAIQALHNGADVNAPQNQHSFDYIGDGKERSALDYAATIGRLGMVKLFLNANALSHTRGETGYDGAVKFAEDNGHIVVADLLRQHAEMTTTDEDPELMGDGRDPEIAAQAKLCPLPDDEGIKPSNSRTKENTSPDNGVEKPAKGKIISRLLPTSPPETMYVRALYNYETDDKNSLSFHEGDVIQVITQLESGWWDGVTSAGVRGWFPSNHCRIIVSSDNCLSLDYEQSQDRPPADGFTKMLSRRRVERFNQQLGKEMLPIPESTDGRGFDST